MTQDTTNDQPDNADKVFALFAKMPDKLLIAGIVGGTKQLATGKELNKFTKLILATGIVELLDRYAKLQARLPETGDHPVFGDLNPETPASGWEASFTRPPDAGDPRTHDLSLKYLPIVNTYSAAGQL